MGRARRDGCRGVSAGARCPLSYWWSGGGRRVPADAVRRRRVASDRRPVDLVPLDVALERRAGQVAAGLLDVRRPHQLLADEHCVDADALELLELLARGDAGLR